MNKLNEEQAASLLENTQSLHQCRKCGTYWRLWKGEYGWSLADADQKAGQCCDNSPEFLGNLIPPPVLLSDSEWLRLVADGEQTYKGDRFRSIADSLDRLTERHTFGANPSSSQANRITKFAERASKVPHLARLDHHQRGAAWRACRTEPERAECRELGGQCIFNDDPPVGDGIPLEEHHAALERALQRTLVADLRRCVAMLNSMVLSGEQHSDESRRVVEEAMERRATPPAEEGDSK